MDNIGSPYVSENPTANGFLSAGKPRNYAMMYSDNTSSRTLTDAKGVKVEPTLLLL